MNIYSKIILRPDYKNSKGLNPVCLRLTINRKVKTYSLKIFVDSNFWDAEKGICKKTAPNWYNNNNFIDQARNKAERIIHEAKIYEKPLSFFDFERLFKGDILNTDSFYEFCRHELKINKACFSSETMRTYTTQISKLEQFRTKLLFSDINHDFLNAYKGYMIETLGNCENTYYKSLTWLKSMINRAIRKGIIKTNPFLNYPLKKGKGNREFLSIHELEAIKNIEQNKLTPGEKNVHNYFLFACYTGLRFTDIKNLQFSHIKKNIDDQQYIELIMHKTKEPVMVPLRENSLKLIQTGFHNQKVFRVLSNQKTNDFLKEIIKKAGINKTISFHCARHTFATISIELGIPLEVTSKLLGHTDIKTTQIYGRILNTKKFKEMERWGSL